MTAAIPKQEERKPNRAERRSAHRQFNALLRRAAQAAVPVTEQAMESQVKERRRLRHARIALESSRRRIARAAVDCALGAGHVGPRGQAIGAPQARQVELVGARSGRRRPAPPSRSHSCRARSGT